MTDTVKTFWIVMGMSAASITTGIVIRDKHETASNVLIGVGILAAALELYDQRGNL